MFNKVILMGRITHDPELKTTPNGIAVCSFSIAVDRRYQTKGEEKKTDFFNIETWRTTAEFVTRYFRKGSMIMVEGELQTQKYTDRNGNPATWYKVIADQVSFTGEKKDDNTAAQQQTYQPPVQNYQPAQAPTQPAPNYQAQYQTPAPNYQAAQNYQQAADMAAIAAKYAQTAPQPAPAAAPTQTQPAPGYQAQYGNSPSGAQTANRGTGDVYPF